MSALRPAMTDDEARELYGLARAAGFRLEPGCRVWRGGRLETVAWAGVAGEDGVR